MAIRVSTITPCFRMKKYLKKFLEELPQQTMFNEMEVVLDHNEPDAEEVQWVKEFQEKYPGRIKHIIVPKVDPIGTSMNRCIREAAGEYLTIWNVDDLRTPDSIETQVKKLDDENKRSNKDNIDGSVGIVYGDYTIVRSFGAKEGTGPRSLVGGTYPQSELTRSMVIGPFFMFKKSLVEKAGYFDDQLKSGADFDLAVRLAFHASAARADRPLGYYLNEGLGASTRPNSKQALDRTTIELRYGIYDKIDYDLVPLSAATHDIPHIIELGQKNGGAHQPDKATPVSKFVPDYTALLESRRKLWQTRGLRRYFFSKIFFTKKIKTALKPHIKKLIKR